MLIVPPIKSQGIKTKLVPWIIALIPQANGLWIEPFVGTGVVAFNVGFKDAALYDVNPHLINFYKALQEHKITPAIVRTYLENEGDKLRRAGNNGYDHYRLIRDRFNNTFNPLDFLFLSRAGFNGMIRFNNKGKWNIPFCKKPGRFSKAYVTKIVNQVALVSCQINPSWKIECKDFLDVILLFANFIVNLYFIMYWLFLILIVHCSLSIVHCFDPPYHGRYVDYYNGWTDQDEKDLFTLLKNTKAKFILSTWHHNYYRENDMINKYWHQFNIVTKEHFYHSGGKLENRNSIVEALVYNFESHIVKHEYELIPEGEQLAFFEKREKYLADRLKKSVPV